MDRLAKGVRVAGAILLFGNLAAFFLPVTMIAQENYAAILLSPFDYAKEIFDGGQDTSQIMVILCLMILPVLLSLAAGMIGIVGSARQLVSGILSFVVVIAYIMLFIWIGRVWHPSEFQTCFRGYGMFIHAAVSIGAALLGIVSFFVRPHIRKTDTGTVIPQLDQIRQEQEMARYNIVEPVPENINQNPVVEPQPQPVQSAVPDYDPSAPRGVMVGLTGLYAGAEIPFKPGESIRIGRLPDNDLVFADQPRVSRNHCTITWKADIRQYMINEYSSNGSYINGKDECLPQNMPVPVQPGTILDIGDAENRFRLE